MDPPVKDRVKEIITDRRDILGNMCFVPYLLRTLNTVVKQTASKKRTIEEHDLEKELLAPTLPPTIEETYEEPKEEPKKKKKNKL